MSDGEETLAFQLKALKVDFDRQFRFAPPRRWTFDFLIKCPGAPYAEYLAIEVEGGAYSGGHKRGAAADTDTEKFNEAVFRGWTVLRFTTAQVTDGRALQTIEKALGRC